MSKLNHILKEKEIILKRTHCHLLIFFWPIFFSVILLLGGFFFLYPLFQKGTWGVILFAIMVFAGFILAIRTFIVWYYGELLITNQRVINFKQKGFFDRQIFGIEYNKINDVSSQVKGIFKTIFHYGNIEISVYPNNKVTIKDIPKPEITQRLITQLCQKVKREKEERTKTKLLTAEEIIENTSMQELTKVIKKLEKIIGKENLEKIIN